LFNVPGRSACVREARRVSVLPQVLVLRRARDHVTAHSGPSPP